MKEIGKEWTHIQDMHLQEDREEWRRLYHKMTHSGGFVSV
jgi:hypothetical protein